MLLSTVLTHPTFAHSFAPALLALHEHDPGVFDVVWKVPPTMVGLAQAGTETLAPELPSHCHRLPSPHALDPRAEGPAFWRVDCGMAGLRGERLTVSGLERSRADVLVRITWHDGQTINGVLRSGADELVIPSAEPSHGLGAGATAGVVLWSYGGLGVKHILLGADHLSFVLGLLLLVDGWGLLFKTISAFTLAHSLALALSVLGVLTVPAAPVEVLIALSIMLVAAELTRAPDAPPTLSRRYPWAVAFAFGLLHGLGFAGALVEIGLPPGQIGLALLGFNLGVEVGQLAFVAVMLIPLALWSRLAPGWPASRLVPPYAIGTLATAWVFERIQQFWVHTL